jgi:hypothetical protein
MSLQYPVGFFFFFPSVLMFELSPQPHACWTGALPLEPLYQPFFVIFFFFFEIVSLELFALGWFQTKILLISAT